MGTVALIVSLLLSSGIIDQPQPLTQRCNCVKAVREIRTDLPYGLFNCSSKAKIATKKTPSVGDVAILREGPVCHVAIVVSITDKIRLAEANYSRCKYGIRDIPTDYSKIIGYY